MSEKRFTELEEQQAHLTRMVEELNEVVTTQAREIDLLTRRVRMLMERLAEEEQVGGGTVALGDQKPPHW